MMDAKGDERMEWIDALNAVLRHIEDDMCGELDMQKLAERIHFSHFYLQRMFAMMTDMSLSEYVRQRRLSLAGQELQATDAKVIDVALKYGYETPESFQKAFRRFHGITPSAAKKCRAQLRFLNPLTLRVELRGGSVMDYTVEQMSELTVVGKERRFRYDTASREIPKFWEEYYAGDTPPVDGCLGICIEEEAGKGSFVYAIANFWEDGAPVPVGYIKRKIPAHTWVKFKVVGAMPEALQEVNRQVFGEWLPNNAEYEMAEGVNIEMYTMGDTSSDEYESEIWLPVKRKG
jgi:AraC family transcriptional regulator